MLALIVFGMNNELEPIGQVNYNCPNCGYTPTNLFLSQRKATVYWIPLFGMGKSYVLGCDNCGYQSEIDDQLAAELQQSLNAPTAAPAPQPVYNPPAPAEQPVYSTPAPAPDMGRQSNYNPVSTADDNPTTVLPPMQGQATTLFNSDQAPLGADSETRRLTLPPTFDAAQPSASASAQTVPCQNCGAAVPVGAKFCQNCGATVGVSAPAPAAVRACPNCGFVQSSGKFCNNCGATFPDDPTA